MAKAKFAETTYFEGVTYNAGETHDLPEEKIAALGSSIVGFIKKEETEAKPKNKAKNVSKPVVNKMVENATEAKGEDSETK
jgi:hypothetical protein